MGTSKVQCMVFNIDGHLHLIQSWLNFAPLRIELLTSKFMNHHQLFMFTVKEGRRRRDGK